MDIYASRISFFWYEDARLRVNILYVSTQASHHKQDSTQGPFSAELVWIQTFLSLRPATVPKLKSLVCPTILHIAEIRWDRFISFPRALFWNEMKTAWSKIWTQVVNSISYSKNHYNKCVYKLKCDHSISLGTLCI